MATKIVGRKGALEGKTFELSSEGECVMGRVPSARVRLDDDLVSRKHCRIYYEDGYYVIEDLKSKNGVWVNGEKISSAPLFHGDIILVGRQEFQFTLDEADEKVQQGMTLRDTNDKFSTEFKEKVPERLATQMGVVAETERGQRSAQEMERDLTAVCRIIDVVNREEPLDKLFHRIMDHVMEVSTADRGYLFSGKELGGVITPQVIRQGSQVPPWLKNTFSRSVVRECYETGFSILRADPQAQESDPSQSIMAQEIQSLMCVPLRCEEGTVGVIYVDKLSGGKKFSKPDLRVLSAIANEAGIAVRRAQLSRRVENLFNEAIRTLVRILEVKDGYTRTHSERVTELAVAIGGVVGLGEAEMRDLRLAGLLHDIGKVAIPMEILTKPSRLTDSEYVQIKMHVTYSSQIVAGIEHAEPIGAILRCHHERWDGRGYPDGLAGEDIPLLGRILAVADSFDSMYGGRSYKDAMSDTDVLAELADKAGTQFDPDLAKQFNEAYGNDVSFRQSVERLYVKEGQSPTEAPAMPNGDSDGAG